MAKLYFRYGAMNSGKSTALMQVAHNYEEQGMRVLILKPKVDTKGSGDLVSRLGVRRPADLLVPPDMDLVEAVRAASSEGRPLACVLCDESQFLTAEQAEQLFMVTVELNIPVMLRPALRLLPQGLPRLHPASGAGPHHRGDEDHLRLWPQGHLQLPQSQRPLRL